METHTKRHGRKRKGMNGNHNCTPSNPQETRRKARKGGIFCLPLATLGAFLCANLNKITLPPLIIPSWLRNEIKKSIKNQRERTESRGEKVYTGRLLPVTWMV